MYKAVLFDLDDTLHNDTAAFTNAGRQVAAELSTNVGVDAQRLARAFTEEIERFWQRFAVDDAKRVPNVRQAMWAAALRRFELDDDELALHAAVRFEEIRKKKYKLFAGVPQMLQSLRDAGAILGLVTNGLTATHQEKIDILDLRRHFDGVFLSDEIGFAKPSPQIFHRVCEVLNVEPRLCIMVGDRLDKDVLGAMGVGMAAIWLNVIGRQATTAHALRYGEVKSIKQLRLVLSQLLPGRPERIDDCSQ